MDQFGRKVVDQLRPQIDNLPHLSSASVTASVFQNGSECPRTAHRKTIAEHYIYFATHLGSLGPRTSDVLTIVRAKTAAAIQVVQIASWVLPPK